MLITQLAGPALALAGRKSFTQDIRFVCWKSLLWAQGVLCHALDLSWIRMYREKAQCFLVLPEYQWSAREWHISYINYESSFLLLKEEGVCLCLG